MEIAKTQKRKSLKVNLLFSAIYQLFKVIVPFITAPYISRVLGVDLVGLYSYSASIVFYFAAIASFGFDVYGNWRISTVRGDPQKVAEVFWEVELAQVITSLFAMAVYFPLVLTNVLGGGEYRTLYLILGVIIVAEMLDTSFLMSGEEEYVSMAIRDMAVKVISTVLIFVLVKERTFTDLVLYTAILSGANLLSSIVVILPSLKYIHRVKFKNLNIGRALFGSLVFFIAIIFSSIYLQLNKTILGVLSSGTAQNGYYEQALKIVNLVISLIASFSSIMISRESYLFSHGKIDEAKKNIHKALNLILLLSIPAVIGLALVGDMAISSFFGDEFEPATKSLYALLFYIVVNPISQLVISAYYIPTKQRGRTNWMTISAAVVDLILCVVLIPSLGAVGASISLSAAQVILFLCLGYYSRKFIDWKTVISKYTIKPIDAALLMGLFLFVFLWLSPLSRTWDIVISIVAGVTIYFGLLLLFKESLISFYTKFYLGKITRRLAKKA